MISVTFRHSDRDEPSIANQGRKPTVTSVSSFITINNLKLHYLDFGNSNKPPVILLHGLNSNAHSFDQLAPHLAPNYHLLALDFRGHGDSEWGPPDSYTPQNNLSDLGEFLEAMNIGKAVLIGSSMGGAMAMIFAAIAPQCVNKLILNDLGAEIIMEPPLNPSDGPGLFATEFSSLEDATRRYREAYQPLTTLSASAAAGLTAHSVRKTANGTWRWKSDPALNSGGSGARSTGTIKMWSFYEKIKASVLIVRGEKSAALTRETVAKMLTVLPQSRSVEVPGVGHTPWLSEPIALRAILEFLNE